ncbi:PA14 domain-containing protein [Streptomyces sp. NPDC050600]|uniref:fibronectin type III domain-containing protein n=1 Tax=Streptomyces sp. NPDC050600 TaxID=3157213 RepID=UPI003427C0C3
MFTRHRPKARSTAAAVLTALAVSGGLVTATPAAAAVTCNAPVWKAQYYANTTFSGTPKLTACDSAVAENYGYGDPAGVTLPKDNFSVRWSLTRDFGSGGPFTFSAEAQDGIRVYLDGVRKIDLWRNVSTTQKRTVNLTVPAGRHSLRVDFAAWTGAANVKFGYGPRTSATVDTVRPLAPGGLSAAYDRTSGRATLRWAANKEMDLAGYRVFRRTGTAGWTPVSGTALVTGTSFANVPPATGESFLYEVRAVDRAGRESLGSADATVVTVDRTAPAAPGGVTATDGATGIALAWQPVPGAARYLVHRQPTGTTEPVTQVAQVTGPAWTDPAVTEKTGYTYWVSAVDAAGNTSPRVTVAAVHRDRAPAAVTGLKATPREDGILLEWDANTEPDLLRYDLYRGEWIPDEESPGGGIWMFRHVAYLGKDATSHLYPAPADGETSAYAVAAVDTAGNTLATDINDVPWVVVTELGTPATG